MDRRLRRMLQDVARAGSSGLEYGGFAEPQFSQLYRKGFVKLSRGPSGQHIAKITPQGRAAAQESVKGGNGSKAIREYIKRGVAREAARRASELRPEQYSDDSFAQAKRQVLARVSDVSSGLHEAEVAGQKLGTAMKAIRAMQHRPDNRLTSLEHEVVQGQNKAYQALVKLSRYIQTLDR